MSKTELRKKYGVTRKEEKEYVLPDKTDYQILALVKTLKGKNLTKQDAKMVELIRTQLWDNWRKPLLEKLKEILQKY